MDSGASSHMCNKKELFDDLKPSEGRDEISVANGEKAAVEGRGNIDTWTLDNKGNRINLHLTNVLFIPTLKKNLISVRALSSKGNTVFFNTNGGLIKLHRKDTTIKLIHRGRLYVLETYQLQPIEEAHAADSLERWHKRMGHADLKMIKKLPESTNGMEMKIPETITPCETCIATKMAKTPFPTSTRRATKPLQLVHTDIAGPIRTPSAIDGHIYLINFIDDYSRFIRVYTIKRKSQALDMLQRFIAEVGQPEEMITEDKTPPEVKGIRSDNGGEYTSKKFNDFCIQNKIKRELTIPYTPEQNGVAERAWRTIFDAARAMLKEAKLEPKWWGRAAITAAYIRNRCLSSSLPDGKTPYELFTGRQTRSVTHSHFRLQIVLPRQIEKTRKAG